MEERTVTLTLDEFKELIGIVERYKVQDTWKSDPLFEEEGFEIFQDIMENGGVLPKRVSFDSLVDNTFAEKAVSTAE